ncbi:MAG TPA: glycosyl transferase [Bacteroidales bacterium]|nr:glycosyl transferase [Bacteroidales bacterium]
MKVLQINTTANSASHGRIAAGIGTQLLQAGHESYIAYGRTGNDCGSELIKIGGKLDQGLHLIATRIVDRHCFSSSGATRTMVRRIEDIQPDVIHLHNVHGYYLNIAILFNYLKRWGKPVIWTFHDTWPITGHCSYFEHVNCFKWETGCYSCPNIKGYPGSWFIDNSRRNYREKRDLFTGLKDMVLVSPSQWLAKYLKRSFLSDFEVRVINNGVDTVKFDPGLAGVVNSKYDLEKRYILGVANIWDERKGLKDFIKLRQILDRNIDIVLVGISGAQKKALGREIKGILRTESTSDLASLYAGAEAFVNPTYLDNFPLVNIEALACGTPVITYQTGGSHEAIDKSSGQIVEKGNVSSLHDAIMSVITDKDLFKPGQCRERAIENYSADDRYKDYIKLYEERMILAQSSKFS